MARLGDILSIRNSRFRGDGSKDDLEPYDQNADHLLVWDQRNLTLAAYCRVGTFASGLEVADAYSAQFYDLQSLAAFERPMLEISRFCLAPDVKDPEALRTTWFALAKRARAQNVAMLFGCSSFDGVDPGDYLDAFSLLSASHLASRNWRPRVKARRVFHFAHKLRHHEPDKKAGLRRMPPLLRSYLAMGARVSDHAVIDEDLGTLHVFTGLFLSAMPRAHMARFAAV